MLSGRLFVGGCALVAAAILFVGPVMPLWLLATEVFATIVALFFLGSFKYQIHKNALTYGMAIVIVATFCKLSTSEWHEQIREGGWWHWTQANLLTFHGLDDVIHADTMLFILGLTFFVAARGQTPLPQEMSLYLRFRRHGATVHPVTFVAAGVGGYPSAV